MWKIFNSVKKKWPLILIVPIFFVYFNRLSPGIFSADSGDMAAAAQILGVPHPPGYPAYTLISHLFLLLPFNWTPAFKIGLFSLLSSIFTLIIFYKFLEASIRNKLVSLVGMLVLAFTYPFWLYSEVVEVFSLNNLFVVIVLFLSYLISIESNKTKIKNLFYVLFFFIGLSLTHHHTILLIFPSIFILLISKKKIFFNNLLFVKCLMLFVLGLSFYLYVPLAARRNLAINWDNAVNLPNFWRLITRADYGSFVYSQSGGQQSLQERFIQIPSFFYFLTIDFGILGLLLGLLGFIHLLKLKKNLFFSIITGFLLSGPIFAFYSAFPINSSFVLGVFERFLVLPYIFWAVAVSFGILFITKLIVAWFDKFKLKRYLKLIIILIPLIFLIYPIKLYQLNREKNNFKNLYLGDYIGVDILNSVPKNSIIFLMGDLYVFNTQYAYYNLGLRNDVKIVLASRFNQIAVRKNFQKSYPNVIVPKDINDKDYLSKLIELNQDHFPIFSVLVGNIPGKWYPYGMLYRLNTDKNPNETAIIKNSIEVYKNYHNPLKYKDKAENNFLFSDIFQTYANARIATGKYLLSNEMYPEAKFQFLEALKLDPAYGEIDKYLGIINLKLGNCLEAEKNFSQYDRKNYFKNKLEYYLLMEQNSKECFKDLKKADSYHREYLKEAAKLETPL